MLQGYVPKYETDCPVSLNNFSFRHAYFLKVDSSGIGYSLALFYMRLKRFQKLDYKNLRI